MRLELIKENPLEYLKQRDFRFTGIFYAITYNCNLRCRFCNNWKIKNGRKELTLDELEEFLPNMKTNFIGITGGEPTLKENLFDCLKILTKKIRTNYINIATNGTMTDRIINIIKRQEELEVPLSITISIDGIRGMHDYMRGVEGTFHKIIKTMKELKKLKYPFDLNMVITKENINHIPKVMGVANRFGAKLTAQICEPLDSQNLNENELKILKGYFKMMEKTIEFKESIRPFYLKTILNVYKSKIRPIPCLTGLESLVLDPFGDIYPCYSYAWGKNGYGNQEFCIGNIKNLSWDRYNEVIKKIKPWECNKCWGWCNMVQNLGA